MSIVSPSWSFRDDHVDTVTPGQFLSAESVFLAAGPPQLQARATPRSPSDILEDGGGIKSDSDVYPVGVVENMMMSQNRQLQRIFEIGSSRSFEIPGRTVGSMSLSRVQYHGISLLRALYATYGGTGSYPFNPIAAQGSYIQGGPSVNPGYDNFFINLASDLFSQPFGLMVYLLDQLENPVASVYAECCHPVSLQSSINAGSILIMEGVAFEFNRLIPIRVTDSGVTRSNLFNSIFSPPALEG